MITPSPNECDILYNFNILYVGIYKSSVLLYDDDVHCLNYYMMAIKLRTL